MDSLIELEYLGLFISSFLSATIIPLSSEIILSSLILNGHDFKLSLLVASTGNWIGGLTSYYLGMLGKWSVLEKYFKLKKEKIIHFKNKIDKYGSILALFCWLPILGDIIAVSLGFFRINFILVASWMLVGKILRYILWSIITFNLFSNFI